MHKLVTGSLVLAAVFAVTALLGLPVQAQTYKIIYDVGNSSGESPGATLLLSKSGRLYGTMQTGPNGGSGDVFEFRRAGAGWIFSPIHLFTAPFGGDDGADPINKGGLTVGPDGSYYGTTEGGGIDDGNLSLGVVFKITPPLTACLSALCPWKLTVLYKFQNSPDGAFPHGNVIFDAAGNIYGTTNEGGTYGYGTVFKLAPSNGGWTETVLHSFPCCGLPDAGLAMDGAGNLYGAILSDYYNAHYGAVFELNPAGNDWNYSVIHAFTDTTEGCYPYGGVVFDEEGNLYATTTQCGPGNGGTVFELSPSDSGWTFQTIYSFVGNRGPQSTLTIDSGGILYGTTQDDGAHGGGSVFRLSPSGGGWNFTSLHDFIADGHDGVYPVGGVTLAPDGTLYGTTVNGGAYNAGVVWQITP